MKSEDCSGSTCSDVETGKRGNFNGQRFPRLYSCDAAILHVVTERCRGHRQELQPTCHFNPPPPDTEVVIACFSTSSCFFRFLSTASGFLTPLYAVSFCLFSAASANCRRLVSGSGVTTTSSAAPPKHGKHIPILTAQVAKGNAESKLSFSGAGLWMPGCCFDAFCSHRLRPAHRT